MGSRTYVSRGVVRVTAFLPDFHVVDYMVESYPSSSHPTEGVLGWAGISLFAALGFLLYGGRIYLMLQRFPVESRRRRKKLQEVGYLTTICFTCFLIRCIMMCFNAFNKAANLDVLYHPVLSFVYYLLVEILPSTLVLFILRKLPPKRGITQYRPIH